MKFKDLEKRKQKWDQIWQKYRLNSARKATIILTVENTLKLLRGRNKGKLLDIGCGLGEIDILLAQKTNFNIIGCDISERALEMGKENVKKAGLEGRIKIEEGDVYNLKYPNEFFDVVLSFGYVSAATYPGAEKEVSRVLKKDGILICDFINCLSLYKFLNSFKRRIINKKEFPYYFTLEGIRKKFEKEGLYFIEQTFFNTYPPINLDFDPEIFILFENTIGKLFKRLLGRVRLIKFIKR